MRSAMIVFCTSLVPPAIDAAFDQSHCRGHWPVVDAARPRPTTRRATVGEVLGHVGPRQLHRRSTPGPGSMPRAEPGERAPVVQPQHAQLDERLRERVGDLDVVEAARSAAPAS